MRLRSAWIVLSIVAVASIAHADDVAEIRAHADAEMVEGRYADAAADYVIAYNLAPDPELLRLIANANEKLGHCDSARAFYRRYLNEAKPDRDTETSINERIAACGGAIAAPAPAPSSPVTTQPPTAAPVQPVAAPPAMANAPASTTAGTPEAPALPFRAGKRVILGLTFGFGIAGHSGDLCTSCESQSRGGTAALELGLMTSPRFAVVAALSTDAEGLVTNKVPEIRQSLEQRALLVGARGWLDRRWWLEGKVGIAKATVPPYFCESGVDAPPDGCIPLYESNGAVLATAVGAELVSRPSFALEARARLALGAYSDVTVTTVTVGLGIAWFP